MLRSTQEEQYKYFYIDRKFGSGNLQQINDALDEIDLFLGKMKKIDLINSLVLRIVDLIPNTKSVVLKHRVASIFKHHQSTLLTIHCRDQIANSLLKYIKTSDEHTRVVCLQIISDLNALFLKDTAVYHLLLAKLSQNNSLAATEKKEAIICLSVILRESKQLGKLFSKSMDKLLKFYAIPLRFILYLLSQILVESHLQVAVLEWGMGEVGTGLGGSGGGRINVKQKRKEIEYFEKVVLRYASNNYHIVQFYQSSRLICILPNIANFINKIKQNKFPFLIPDYIELQQQRPNHTVESLIDQLYQKKVTGNLIGQYHRYHQIIYSAIDDYFSLHKEIGKIILLLYFVQDNINHYDRLIKRNILNKNLAPTKNMFKQLVVVGCFQSALYVLNQIDMPQTNYIFLKLYLQLKLQKEPKQINQLKQIAQILNSQLFQIIKAWQIMDKILRLWLATSNATGQLFAELKNICNLLKQKKTFAELTQVISIFAECRQNQNPMNLKRKCYHILPSSIISTNSFWFAHLNKQSILAFFNMVL